MMQNLRLSRLQGWVKSKWQSLFAVSRGMQDGTASLVCKHASWTSVCFQAPEMSNYLRYSGVKVDGMLVLLNAGYSRHQSSHKWPGRYYVASSPKTVLNVAQNKYRVEGSSRQLRHLLDTFVGLHCESHMQAGFVGFRAPSISNKMINDSPRCQSLSARAKEGELS